MLTEEQKENLDARLEQLWTGSHSCPICGRDQWNRIDIVFQQSPHKPTPTSPGGPTIPLIHMSCYHCGYVLSFNAITLKLVKPLISSSREEDEETTPEQIGDVLKLTEKKLEAMEQVNSATSNTTDDAQLDRLAKRTLNLLFLGALLSLVSLANGSSNFMLIFLSQVAWYFFAAIVFYFLTSTREHASLLSALQDTSEQQLALTEGIQQPSTPLAASPSQKSNTAIHLLVASQILVVLFIASFMTHFYLFAFHKLPFSTREELLFNLLLVAAGLAFYILFTRRQKTSR